MGSICPKCSSEHTKVGRFCSRKCANSRERSSEVRAKISEGVRSSEKFRLGQSKRDHVAASQKGKIARIATWKRKLADIPFEKRTWNQIRKQVIAEQQQRCCSCGRSEWLGQPLTLEINHKDGNNRDHKRSNLEGLCPNCHSLTSTWRGRNKNKTAVSDQDLLTALNEHGSVRQALLAVGLAGKGGNYKRVKRLRKRTGA